MRVVLTDRQREDLAFLKDRSRWSFNKLLCPVKHRERRNGPFAVMGVVAYNSGQLYLIEDVTVFAIKTSDLIRAKRVTAEDIINQNWMVD